MPVAGTGPYDIQSLCPGTCSSWNGTAFHGVVRGGPTGRLPGRDRLPAGTSAGRSGSPGGDRTGRPGAVGRRSGRGQTTGRPAPGAGAHRKPSRRPSSSSSTPARPRSTTSGCGVRSISPSTGSDSAALYGAGLARPTCQIIPPTTTGYRPYCPYTVDPDAAGTVARPGPARAPGRSSTPRGQRGSPSRCGQPRTSVARPNMSPMFSTSWDTGPAFTRLPIPTATSTISTGRRRPRRGCSAGSAMNSPSTCPRHAHLRLRSQSRALL